jgi:translation initiation factor 5B
MFENFAATFCSLNVSLGIRYVYPLFPQVISWTTVYSALFFLGLLAGGPLAMWSSSLITVIFLSLAAAMLAEICSVIPLCGSIYIWAAEAAESSHGHGARGQFVGYV